MGTSIEWTDETWNPVTGCTHVSAGCDNCYADTLANSKRLRARYLAQLPVDATPKNCADPFAVRLWPERLTHPSKWREPRMVFVNSMSDMFHVDIPRGFLGDVFWEMLRHDRHTYQVLTKRPARAAKRLHEMGYAIANGTKPGPRTGTLLPPHIWIGTSVESQDVAYRVDHLRAAPASVRFLSCEPLLGPLTLDLTGIHWLIAGGESGACTNRPRITPDVEWIRSLRDQCIAAGVPFFFKQWGGRTPKAGGRLLDGREWNEFPDVTAQVES